MCQTNVYDECVERAEKNRIRWPDVQNKYTESIEFDRTWWTDGKNKQNF